MVKAVRLIIPHTIGFVFENSEVAPAGHKYNAGLVAADMRSEDLFQNVS